MDAVSKKDTLRSFDRTRYLDAGKKAAPDSLQNRRLEKPCREKRRGGNNVQWPRAANRAAESGRPEPPS
jgi:hypothetical protein